MRAGQVEARSLVLGGNPAYDAPADLEFATAAAKAEELVHFGSHVDETAALACVASRARTSSSRGATRAQLPAR